MHCTYTGNFNDKHETTKKRRLIGPTREKAISLIVDKKMACETVREREAVRLMKIGILFSIIL